MSANWKQGADHSKDGEESFNVLGQLEPPHVPFSVSGGLVRVLRSIVELFVAAMIHAWHHCLFGGGVAVELVGRDHARHRALALQQLPEKSFRRFGIAS